ncbi:MAG: GGDEF domain-containing protein [Chromatiales bacterium]|jgi:diguanylate cyclase|nr:GGDEF domain-containing protein [Chromatiales bacterium]
MKDKPMTENPYKESREQAAEYLRLTLALLSKNGIPVSPLNYRMGYDSVAGNNNILEKTLELVPKDAVASLDEHLWLAYQQAYAHEIETLNNIRSELRGIIISLQHDMQHSGSTLSEYALKLNQFSEFLIEVNTPEGLNKEIEKTIAVTNDTAQGQRSIGLQIAQVSSDLDALRQELVQVRKESLTDHLTGLSNRKAFDTAIDDHIQNARSNKSVFSVLIADIDHFKAVNDKYGHLVGDKVLRFVAATIRRCIKGKDFAARFGGEEFAIILDNTNITGAGIVAEQIRQAIYSGVIKDVDQNRALDHISISLGIAEFRDNDLAHSLLRRSDEALYLAKQRGRNRVEKITGLKKNV